MRKSVIIPLLALSLSAAPGCGDSTEIKLQQAQIALANDRFDKALESAQAVLNKDPANAKAKSLKAEAQMRLAQLDEGRKTIESMLKDTPDSAEPHRLMVTWSFRQMFNTLKQSDFAAVAARQRQFDDALALGQTHAQWLAAHGQSNAEAQFMQARLAEADARRLQSLLQTQQKSLANTKIDDGSGTDQNDPAAIERKKMGEVTTKLQQDADARLAEAEGHLKEAVAADPRLFDAADMYARLLAEREDWATLWVLAQRLGTEKDLPATVVGRLAGWLWRMPDAVHSVPERIEIAAKLQAAVAQAQKEMPDWKLTEARLDLARKEPDKARKLLEQVRKARPRDSEPKYFLAQALYSLGKYPEARDIAKDLATQLPRNARVHSLYGMTLEKTGNLSMAKEALRRATELDPDDPSAREAFLRVMAQQGHLDEGEREVDAYYQQNPADPRAIRFKMQFEQGRGQPQAVADLLDRVEKLTPLTDEHVQVLIDGYSSLQKFDRVETFAREMVKRRPDAIESHLSLAGALLMLGRDDEVKQMLTDLRVKFPKSASVDQMLGRLYLQRQSFDKAVDLFQRTVAAEPNNTDARLQLAQALASLSLTDEAMEQVNRVLEQEPDNAAAHAMAARIYQFTGQSEKANEQLGLIAEGKIDRRTNPALLAQLKVRAGDLDAARDICNEAISRGDSDPVLRILLAGVYLKQGDNGQAENHLLALARSQPNNPQAYAFLANFYVQTKNVDKGLNELQALQLQNEVLALMAQAQVLAQFNRVDDAIAKLTKIYEPLIAKRDPRVLSVADALAKLQIAARRGDAAFAVYQALIDKDLVVPQATLRQIEITSGRDGPDATTAKLDALAAKLGPGQDRLSYQVMRHYVQLGRNERALSLLDTWMASRPKEAMLVGWKGELLMEMGRGPDAVAAFRKAIEMAPEDKLYRGRLAQAQLASFDYPAAETTLRAMSEMDSGAKLAALASLGRMYVSLGLNRQAAATFDELERAGRPKDPRVILAMGQARSSLGQDDQALSRLAEVPNFTAQYPTAQILMARIEQRQGKSDDARKRLEALAKEPRTAAAATNELMALNVRNRQDEEVLAWADKALAIEKLPPQMKLQWLQLRLAASAGKHDWPAVLDGLTRVAELKPGDVQTQIARVAVLLRLDKVNEAALLVHDTPAIASSPVGRSVQILVRQAPSAPARSGGLIAVLEAMAMGDADAARSAVENSPPARTIYKNDLKALLGRTDLKSPQAVAEARMLLLAAVAIDAGLPDLAADLSGMVAQKDPGMVLAQALQLHTLLQLGDPTEPALVLIRKGADSTLKLYVQAYDQQEKGDSAGAVATFRKILEAEPGNVFIQYDLSQQLQRAGQFDDAMSVLRGLVAGDTAFKATAMNDLSYLIAEHNPAKMDEAYALAQQALAAAPQNAALLDTIGWIEHLRGDDAKAIGLLSKAIVALTTIPEVHYHMGVVYEKLGNKEWARYHLQEAAAGPAERPETAKAKALLASL